MPFSRPERFLRGLLSLSLCGLLLAPCTRAAAPERKPIVIVISLDAFGAALLQEPLLPVPTLHALMQSGTYARSMQPVNPTITWPNHTAMVTGVPPAKHGLIANGLIVDERTGKVPHVEFHADKATLVHVPTVYDTAHAAGLVTAEMDWVAIENTPSIDWSFFEQPVGSSPLIQEMLRGNALTQVELDNFRKASQAYRDRIYTRAAVFAIRQHHPNLLLLHLLSLDSAEHTYGFDTMAGVNTAAFLDDRVKEVVDAVRAAGDLERTTFLIVSDHGQSSVHHSVDPNAVLQQAGISPEEATALDESGVAYVYETHASPALETRIRDAFAKNPATDSIPTAEQIVAQGWPRPSQFPTAPDMLVYAKEGWEFGGPAVAQHSAAGVAVVPQTGAHGYPNTRPLMQSIVIANGATVRAGGEQPPTSVLDIAPTIAHILGLPTTGMDGVPLTGYLKEQ